MINSFSQFLVEENKVVYFTFGRMNPPTIGHGKLLDKLASVSGRNPYRVYLSQSQDPKKNPLSYKEKVKHVRKMFPKHARSVVSAPKVKTAIDAMVDLYNQGFRKVVMIVGSDRIREFDVLLNKYNGEQARHGFYDFMDIKVVSAGDRDPDADGAEGASATKQREAAAANDFVTFSQGVPPSMSNNDTRKLFNDVRKGMGLKESNFKNHIALEPVSNIREAYVTGRLFNQGDYCIVKETSELGTVAFLGSNYVVVEMSNGKRFRKWLTDVEPLEDIQESALVPDWLHKAIMAPKMKKMVRMYLDWRRDNPGQGQAGVQKVIQMMGLNPRDGNQLIDKLNDMVKKGEMPKHLAIESVQEEAAADYGTPKATNLWKKATPGEKVSEDEYDRYRDRLAAKGLHPRNFRRNIPGPPHPPTPRSPEQDQRDKENREKARKAAWDNLSKTFGKNFQTNSVNEISPDLKQRYAKKAQSDIGFIKKDLSIAKDMDVPDVKKKLKRQLQTRRVGVARATEPPVKKNIYDQNEQVTTRQDKDISQRKGTQPARYHTGLAPATKAARDAQFKRQTKMSDKDPAAYRPAPGDATAKTKPSKYTAGFRSMFGEEVKGKQLVHHGETTKNFDMCPGALKAFDQNQKDGMGDKPGFHDAVVAVDKYLGLEKQLMKKGQATEKDLERMMSLVADAKKKISDAGLKGHDYHSVHINSVKKMVNND